ncbi:hypothetical protein COMA2_80145 [Candidatus Nitrospira nitrificans]|uniref:Uncharacterized protein n=1 Tax=Candidatus Nitrospira nitrificans TaxID=1742973 RepID=A0A0S4LQ92_9BACT|nr:hypothetical protein COMA2_80145 [Candidatus Nitrospira nitrificans]
MSTPDPAKAITVYAQPTHSVPPRHALFSNRPAHSPNESRGCPPAFAHLRRRMTSSASRLMLPALIAACIGQLLHERNQRLAGDVHHVLSKGTPYLQSSLLQAHSLLG